jgi:hypothetical protein
MSYLTIAEQDELIRRDFPDFRLTAAIDWVGVWEGPVRPILRTYRIRIVHFRRRFFDDWSLQNHYISVYVVDPLIGAEAREKEQVLPHIYWNDRRPEYPALCLFDPRDDDWSPEQSIAETIIPWASQWLFFYEYWQITGRFMAPGRHPPRRRGQCAADAPLSESQIRFRNVQFHKLGQRLGIFGS